ncbi:hypothetical protein FA95DRAFT_1583171 [Auriscalpium vulgare]|uniref:Uncharacterized protein n=1 Tax=Auriscalpium vulgare TaxID=40419 RepID=A0ACB8RRD6_9AGAM|nr:hypothetical protein FA95DRAFT_1583171 [Auriscalpium vulgare]
MTRFRAADATFLEEDASIRLTRPRQFYSEAILSRRGPLAKVWLAAHMERKLSKAQTLQTDIEQSVDAIMGQEIEVMALRLSGQLLLGVVRIYSRKAKYLLDDCNEALLKIKMAFRPGIVDMTEDQLAVNRNAITLQAGGLDLDVLLPDINWDIDFEDRVVQPQGHHVARQADITLNTADDLQYDLEDQAYGFDLGPSDGIGSQDYEVDLGLDFGDAPASSERARSEFEDDDMSVGVGRDAAAIRDVRQSLGSDILGRGGDDLDVLSHRSRAPSENPFAGDFDFGADTGMDIDLGLDFGDRPPPSEGDKTPGQTRSLSRASDRVTTASPLTQPPETPPALPDTAPDVAGPEGQPDEPAVEGKKKRKERKQIIDDVTELQNGRGRGGLGPATSVNVSSILTEHHYLPRSSLVMRLLEIREDPVAHFLPTKVTPNGTYFFAGPPGMAPELQEMFMRPVQTHAAGKRRATSPEKPPSKRARLDPAAELEEEVEQGRRAVSVAPSVALGSEALGRASVGPGLEGGFEFDNAGTGLEDFQMDVGDLPSADVGLGMERARSVTESALSRLSTPAVGEEAEGEETYANADSPIAVFDMKGASQATETPETAEVSDGKGYSKNTIRALGIIRGELQPVDGEDEEKFLSFTKMSAKASRRAASSFFFELLVLGTRDCVKLSQSAPFENIEVRAKDKLWERQRHGSVAASIASSMGL